MYHYTRNLNNSRYPRIKALDISLFRQQIEFLNNSFTIVSMEQVLDCIKGRGELPDNAMLLTFDDGYIDNYNYAFPILEEYGVQGSFFITGMTFSEHKLLDVNKIHYILASGNIENIVADLKKEMDYYRSIEDGYAPTDELYNIYAVASRFDNKDTIFVKRMLQTVLPNKIRNIISSDLFKKYVGVHEETMAGELYMTEEQIKTLKRHGMYIGVHGYDHCWLGNISRDEVEKDISRALDVMDRFIDSHNWVMNYPYGSYNKDVVEVVKSTGAVMGLTTEVDVADFDKYSVFELPRFDCNDFPPKSNNYINI